MTLLEEVDDAIAKMTWLQPTDQATVALARTYAEQIDATAGESGPERTKALYLGPHLLKALSALGGTPLERRELTAKDGVGGNLAKLRAVQGETKRTG